MELFENYGKFSEHKYKFMKAYSNTGKTYNDFGRFQDCVENKETEYMLLNCKEDRCSNRFPVDISIGLCIPKPCSKDDIMIVLPFMLPYINAGIMPYQFTNLNQNDIKKSMHISSDELTLVDSF